MGKRNGGRVATESQHTGRKREVVRHRCGDCALCVPVRRFHTLNVKGEPTLGECPHWTESRCVLLSWVSDCKFFKSAVGGGESNGEQGA